jgi:hypothetical protein
MSRSTSRSVRYSRLRLPTVTFTEVGAGLRSRAFSKEIALLPIRTVTNLFGRVTEPKSPDHRNASMVEGGTLTPRTLMLEGQLLLSLDDYLAAAGP